MGMAIPPKRGEWYFYFKPAMALNTANAWELHYARTVDFSYIDYIMCYYNVPANTHIKIEIDSVEKLNQTNKNDLERIDCTAISGNKQLALYFKTDVSRTINEVLLYESE